MMVGVSIGAVDPPALPNPGFLAPDLRQGFGSKTMVYPEAF